MATTNIEWTDVTWNPTRGCRRVSPGCEHCYAEKIAARFSGPGQPYEGLAERRGPVGGRWTGEGMFVEDKLLEPLSWRKPRRVFVNSMSDLFYEEFTELQIARVFAVMALAPQHTFQVLTKRAERMQAWVAEMCGSFAQNVRGSAHIIVSQEYERARGCGRGLGAVRSLDDQARRFRWPLPNVWLGVSVENRKHGLPRLAHLRATPAAVRFLSIEPLLEDLGTVDLAGIDWVIAGAESGVRARPSQLDWYRSIRDQCQAAGVRFFFKQFAEHADGKRRPAVTSLPVLDGRQWAEFPGVPDVKGGP